MAQRRFYVSTAGGRELLATAFYRFLEVHSRTTVDDDGLCSMRSEFDGPLEVKVLSFWSEHAASEFVRFLQDFSRVYARPDISGEIRSTRPPLPPGGGGAPARPAPVAGAAGPQRSNPL